MPASHTSESQLGFLFEEPASTRRVWPVSELVAHARQLVERTYGDVWVEGEISNCRSAPSGHVYFTLKDADAQLPVVLFRRQALLLRFRPLNMDVLPLYVVLMCSLPLVLLLAKWKRDLPLILSIVLYIVANRYDLHFST